VRRLACPGSGGNALTFDALTSNDRESNLAGHSPGPELRQRIVSRRRLLAGAAALGTMGLLGIAEHESALNVSAQTEGTPLPGASPSAATPQATLTGPEMIGQLQVIRDPRPVYTGTPTDSGELRLMLATADNSDFSPAAFRQDFQIMASYLDPLVWIDEVTMEPVPGLAERWEVTDGGTTITYKLRDDVEWHDGSSFQARDVVFSFFVYRDDLDSAVRNFFVNMQSAEATDRSTVVVTLTSPDANWLLNASSQFIFQRAQYSDYWNDRPEGERTLTGFNWRSNPAIGTGPWKLDKASENATRFQRNDQYWRGTPHFEELVIEVQPDPQQRLDEWKAGQTDLLWPVTYQMVQAASDTPGKLYVADSASVMFAAFNFDNPESNPNTFFSDLRIRQALNLAIDRNRYATEVFGGFTRADRAGTVAQPWANDPSVVNPARDVTTARALLTEAGWSVPSGGHLAVNAAGIELKMSVIVRNDAPQSLNSILQSIVQDLAEIGIELQVRALSPERFFTVWTVERDYDLIAYAYNLFPGFTDFDLYGSNWDIRQNPQGWNPGGYSNETVDQVLRAFLTAEDMTEARDALQVLQQTVNDDLFGLWFGFPQELILVRPEILGFQPNILWETWNTWQLWRTTTTT
jgi:peptide/nickel transport system substrate-binding protein